MTKCFSILLTALAMAPVCLHAAETAPLVASVLDKDVMRLQIRHLSGDLAAELRAAQPTNKLDGVILDLRSADGEPDAVPAATHFFAAEKIPLVILVNGQTCDGAAALVAQLRSTGTPFVIGSTNAAGKIRPDIAVAVTADNEKKFLENPYFHTPAPATFSATNSLLPFVDHMSEAELVRRKIKDGEGDDESAALARPAPAPVIRDPALARAVDLLKALAVLQPVSG